MKPVEIVLVNPPTMVIRPERQLSGTFFVDAKHRVFCINPGIISIASYLASRGVSLEIADFQEEEDLDTVRQALRGYEARVFGISSTSGFDYLECLEIAEMIKQEHPGCLLIAGGQHIGVLGEIVFRDTDAVDIVVKQEGEHVTEEILQRTRAGQDLAGIKGIVFKAPDGRIVDTGRTPKVDLDQVRNDFTLFPDFRKFTPFVEESRGCAYGCAYCANTLISGRRIAIKHHERFAEELRQTIEVFGRDKHYAVLSSNFGVNVKNTIPIIDTLAGEGILWQSEIRVDNPWHKYIDKLLSSGMEVVSVGLESASPTILRYMNKTKDPERYLELMEQLLARFASAEPFLRLNMMIYAGETPETLNESISFFARHQGDIDAIMVSPIMAFENTGLWDNLPQFQRDHGTEIVDDDYWKGRRLYPLHPASWLSFEESSALCNVLEKIYSKPEAWVVEKQYQYKQESEEDISQITESLRESRFKRS
jgi:radical SAM superfamily enzyme YgiQ (UPF0313 family)